MVVNKKTVKDLNITIGTDPELFLKDKSGKIAPAYLFVKGNKHRPEPISGEGHAIQYDNVMLEYNIPPCKTEEEFVKHNKFVLDYVKDALCTQHNLDISIVASDHISEEYLTNEIASEFGCDPDYNAYTGEQNTVSRSSLTLRSCAGHLHIAYDGLNYEKAMKIIKALDLFISIPLVIIEPNSDRKELYGKAGAYRFKKLNDKQYIVEYRSPSNFIISSEDIMKFAFQQCIKAIEFIEIEDGIITNESDVISAINNNDENKAKEIIEDYHIEIPEYLIPIKAELSKSDSTDYDYENDSLGG